MIFSLQIFEDFFYCRYKGLSKICCADIVKDFTNKTRKFSEIKLILNKLQDVNHNLKEELAETDDLNEAQQESLNFSTSKVAGQL